jgi:pyruvate dehydrogenase E2 component (dihydrolipoamide acetyltransferase)
VTLETADMGNYEFALPDIGEGLVEGEIVRWMVKEGDAVKEEQAFVEVMTDKATVTITSPVTGKVTALKAKEGEVVAVGKVIAVFDAAGSARPPAAHGQGHAPAPAPAPAAKPAPAATPTKAPAPAPAAAAAPTPQSHPSAPAPMPAAAQGGNGTNGQSAPASPGKVLAAPATRRRAREMGIDLATVEGTGPRGRVMNEDLNRFLSSGGKPAAAPGAMPAAARGSQRAPVTVGPAPAGKREERVPFRGVRRKIAEAMTRSKHTAAHFTYVEEMDVTELVALRKEAKEYYKDSGVNLTYLPFIMKAVIAGLRKYPWLNSTLDEATQEVVIKHYYNLGIAVDTDNGLMVPVVKDAEHKTIAELAREVQELAGKARGGKITAEDLQGGTFTLTNAGNIGGLMATPVINFPEVAILGVHKIARRPVVRNEQIAIGDVMWLSISIDHRIVDGATGAHFMNVVKDLLEHPKKLLLGSL